ncbi:MAG TPA: gluconokinase [Hyphomicrobiaceae bacterium]|jgi:gluconokinase|nr:gluconokinase [Hyphomicrobiaceae bacterium]
MPDVPTDLFLIDRVPRVIVLMGVSGSGKTTLGTRMAKKLGVDFTEGDSFHSAENVSKMRAGVPLDDSDRWPWLMALGQALRRNAERQGHAVGACSALKRKYRDLLRSVAGEIFFVALLGGRLVIEQQLRTRQHEYMPASLLDSQLRTLEPLQVDELGASIDIQGSESVSLDRVLQSVGLSTRTSILR